MVDSLAVGIHYVFGFIMHYLLLFFNKIKLVQMITCSLFENLQFLYC